MPQCHFNIKHNVCLWKNLNKPEKYVIGITSFFLSLALKDRSVIEAQFYKDSWITLLTMSWGQLLQTPNEQWIISKT